MLDDLRDQADFQPEEKEPLPPVQPERPQKRKGRDSSGRKGGMTAPQRFVLSLLLLVVVCLAGVMFLVMTGKVVLPFSF